MKQTPYPYRSGKQRIHNLKPVKLEDEGTEGKIPKYAWLSDGPIRPIERGLPILETFPSALDQTKDTMDSLITLLRDKPYLKDFYKTYGALAARHPEYDLNDPDMMTHYEKQLIAQYSKDSSSLKSTDLKLVLPSERSQTGHQQTTTKIPLDAHLHTWGGAIPYLEATIFPEDDIVVPEKKIIKKKIRTGIHGDPDLNAEDESAIIRPIHFKTLSEEEAQNQTLSRDSATQPLVFAQGGRRFSSSITRLPGGRSDPTVKKCIKRFFDPEVGIPFVPADVGKYFPTDLLIPEETPETMSRTTDVDSTMMTSLVSTNPNDECDPRSTLIDTSDQDVLFTVNKAPFTRNDISTLRAFGAHWDNMKIRQREKAEQQMKARQSMIKQAFHNKEVFETYLKLMDEDCKRIRSGVLGKSPYKKKSLWQVAIEKAPIDHSGLVERRTLWWRFCAFVRFLGGAGEQLEKDFVKLLRVKLMLRHPIDQSLFWDMVNDVNPVTFEHVATLRLIEFCRVVLDVGQEEFNNFLDEKRVSHMIYNQTILNNMSREYTDKLNQIAKGPIDVPEMD